ncbi:hypothetical protein JNM87_00800 [Candidatus Saccharibacteria bacterium]|nr:hypothetical protein [Candidatus Saccharibacteria bacterium]
MTIICALTLLHYAYKLKMYEFERQEPTLPLDAASLMAIIRYRLTGIPVKHDK